MTSLRRFLSYLRRRWFVIRGGCELCGERKDLAFYDMGRLCRGCYRREYLNHPSCGLGAGLLFLQAFYKKTPVK